ncbi:hypothetical protein JMG10_25555 [Nostoc ellipsosporum NOK]|nr:hypothetical protein [Nostoc ellipsosporum NOK]
MITWIVFWGALEVAEITGTSFLVHGQWYLRYLGGGGAMIPISGTPQTLAALADNKTCILEGYMSTDGRGCAQGVQATAAKTIGI